MWIIAWVFLSIIVGLYAGSKGRSRVVFFFLSVMLSPLVAFLIAMGISASNIRQCPFCAEDVKEAAKVCKHCGKEIEVSTTIEIDPQKQIPCPFCGSNNKPDADLCIVCEKPVSA